MTWRIAPSGGLCSLGGAFSQSRQGARPYPASLCTWRSNWKTHAPSMASSWSCMWSCETTRASTESWPSSWGSSSWSISSTWWTPVTTPQWRCCGSGTGCLRDSTAQRSIRQRWRSTCLGTSTRTSRRTWRTSCLPLRRACAPTVTVRVAFRKSRKPP